MANEPVTLEQVKVQLRLDPSDSSQDDYLKLMIAAASREIERYTGRKIVETHSDLEPRDRSTVALACLISISHWYVNREGGETMPPAARSLVRDLRRRWL